MNNLVTYRDVYRYLQTLVDHFFKILPMWEDGEPTLPSYLQSFQIELSGCGKIIGAYIPDASYVSLLSILQYFIDNPECNVSVVRREVFHAISICNGMRNRYEEAMKDERV